MTICKTFDQTWIIDVTHYNPKKVCCILVAFNLLSFFVSIFCSESRVQNYILAFQFYDVHVDN